MIPHGDCSGMYVIMLRLITKQKMYKTYSIRSIMIIEKLVTKAYEMWG